MSLLHIKDLRLGFKTLAGQVDVLHGIDLDIAAGEKIALVGESGSGKSVTARIVLGLLQETRTARINGTVQFDGQDINSMSARDRATLRGTEMSIIFQDPTSSLNPMFTIGNQFTEVLRRRDPKLSKADSHVRATTLLDEVAIPDPARVLRAYPFQLSGGMNQRVMIAMALANKPKLLLADEPGTALDVSVQAQTLTLMRDMVVQNGTSVLFISHNLGVVREFADRIYVIYRGNIVEDGPTDALFANPQHAYTRALMSAVPRITGVGIPEVPEVSDDFLAPRISHGDAL
ncbi:MAG: ABC transporter ATP-binding protein [Paracoccaceae bacterium]|jgi:ABC-type dipeptide/oligopeptide/nickel transport system ATPase component|nr:ABC transporter ATP-binding protein [Paracoccaceae bacterium]|tara:strand:- start:7759 stop:8625 length:867 start_codon:yes stop_codon:yes gene_type:complete